LESGRSNKSGSLLLSGNLAVHSELPGLESLKLLSLPGFDALEILQGTNSTLGVISASRSHSGSDVTDTVTDNLSGMRSLRADVWDGVAWRSIGMYFKSARGSPRMQLCAATCGEQKPVMWCEKSMAVAKFVKMSARVVVMHCCADDACTHTLCAPECQAGLSFY
jgi:hypothetical protein